MNSTQQVRFNNMIAHLEEISKPSSRMVINDQLQVTNRRGCKWLILSLLRPFACLFCRDVYSHYRINKVAAAVLKACEENKEFLKTKPALLQTVTKWISNLETRAKGKHDACLKTLRTGLSKLTAPLPPKPEPVKPKVETPPPPQPKPKQDKPPVKSDPPAPKTHYRSESRISYQHNPNDFQIKWPSQEDLEVCKYDEAQMGKLKQLEQDLKTRFIPRCFGPSPLKLHFVKEGNVRTLQLLDQKGEVVDEIKPCISLEVIYKGEQLQDVLLLTKHIVGQGAETKVRLCFSLFQGINLVRKKCSNVFQRELIEYFYANPSRGIVPIVGIRESQANGKIKVQSLEHFKLLNLREFILNGEKPSFENRLKAAIDILDGVAAIHRAICSKYELPNRTFAAPFGMFHSDANPSNILFDIDSNSHPVNGALTDFGSANPVTVGGTAGFKAPEQIELCLKYKTMSPEAIIAHNVKYGQSSDVWSTGLVLIALITWKLDSGDCPPLPCITACLTNTREGVDSITVDRSIAKIQQREIDANIQALRKECLAQDKSDVIKTVTMNKLWNRVWDVITHMVKKDPAQRKGIEAIRDEFNAIKNGMTSI